MAGGKLAIFLLLGAVVAHLSKALTKYSQINYATNDHLGHAYTKLQCQGNRQVIVHLFEWKWPDIANECEAYLGPKGYCAVQVSPPMEHVQGNNLVWQVTAATGASSFVSLAGSLPGFCWNLDIMQLQRQS